MSKALKQSSKPAHLELSIPGSDARKGSEPENEDLEAVGMVIEGSKPYVFQAVYFICQAAGIVLLEVICTCLRCTNIGCWNW